MATKKRSTIKSRRESISATKPKTLSSILKGQTKLSRSFKESLAIGAAVAGPGKFLKPLKKVADLAKAKKGTPSFASTLQKATAKATKSKKAAAAREKGRAIKLAKKDPKEGKLRREDLAFERRARKSLENVKTNPSKKTVEKRVRQLKLKASRKAPSFRAKRSTSGKSTRVSKQAKVPKDSRGRDVEGNFQEIEGRRVFVPDK
jgi:hypothetical protein